MQLLNQLITVFIFNLKAKKCFYAEVAMFIRKNRCCCCISSDIEKLHSKTKRVKDIMDGREHQRMLYEHQKKMADFFKKRIEANKAFGKKGKDSSIDTDEKLKVDQAESGEGFYYQPYILGRGFFM